MAKVPHNAWKTVQFVFMPQGAGGVRVLFGDGSADAVGVLVQVNAKGDDTRVVYGVFDTQLGEIVPADYLSETPPGFEGVSSKRLEKIHFPKRFPDDRPE